MLHIGTNALKVKQTIKNPESSRDTGALYIYLQVDSLVYGLKKNSIAPINVGIINIILKF